jgi:hypothetical protein
MEDYPFGDCGDDDVPMGDVGGTIDFNALCDEMNEGAICSGHSEPALVTPTKDNDFKTFTIEDMFDDDAIPSVESSVRRQKYEGLGHVSVDEIMKMHPSQIFRLVIDYIAPPFERVIVQSRRLKGKQPCTNWRLLLRHAISNPNTWALNCKMTWKKRYWAQYTMCVWIARLTGQTLRDVKKRDAAESPIGAFSLTDDRVKSRFWFLRCLEHEGDFKACFPELYQRKRGTPIGSAMVAADADADARDLESVLCYGFSATYNTNVGLRDPTILQWIQEGLRNEDLRDKLRTHELMKSCFSRFVQHIQRIATKLTFPTWAVAMEHSDNSSQAARVHFHAFAGVDISRGFGIMRPPRAANVSKTALIWEGCSPPFVKYTYFKKMSANLVYNSVATAMYYVAGAKKTAVFVEASAWPFKVSTWSHQRIRAQRLRLSPYCP